MKLAAVDIGSNAVRLQVSSVLLDTGQPKFKRVEYIRFPLRLGDDVFKKQCISVAKANQLFQLLKSFQLLIELYQVDAYMVCATSAFRDANNKYDIIHRVQEELGISIAILKGEEEALLIHEAICHLLDAQYNHLHVEVGGGSTEVSIYKGVQKVTSRSFDLGTVRLLAHGNNSNTAPVWETMQEWMHIHRQHFKDVPIGIATGGNIRKLAQLTKKGVRKPLSLKKLEATKDFIAAHSVAERINGLALNPDRADVILPAMEIYSAAMRLGGVKKILVPDISLRDGIIRTLYKQACNGDIPLQWAHKIIFAKQ